MNTTEARDTTATLRRHLEQPGARCPKRQAYQLIGLVERLADALDQARAELRRREDYTAAYGALVDDWNPLVEGLRALGVEVSQPAGCQGWRWSWGQQHGEEPTIPAAYLAALRAAGVVRLVNEEERT